MSHTPHFGKFDDTEVLTLEAFAARIGQKPENASRLLDALDYPGLPYRPTQRNRNANRGIAFVSCHLFRLAIERGAPPCDADEGQSRSK